jgi:hypothetical protein
MGGDCLPYCTKKIAESKHKWFVVLRRPTLNAIMTALGKGQCNFLKALTVGIRPERKKERQAAVKIKLRQAVNGDDDNSCSRFKSCQWGALKRDILDVGSRPDIKCFGIFSWVTILNVTTEYLGSKEKYGA